MTSSPRPLTPHHSPDVNLDYAPEKQLGISQHADLSYPVRDARSTRHISMPCGPATYCPCKPIANPVPLKRQRPLSPPPSLTAPPTHNQPDRSALSNITHTQVPPRPLSPISEITYTQPDTSSHTPLRWIPPCSPSPSHHSPPHY